MGGGGEQIAWNIVKVWKDEEIACFLGFWTCCGQTVTCVTLIVGCKHCFLQPLLDEIIIMNGRYLCTGNSWFVCLWNKIMTICWIFVCLVGFWQPGICSRWKVCEEVWTQTHGLSHQKYYIKWTWWKTIQSYFVVTSIDIISSLAALLFNWRQSIPEILHFLHHF